MRVIAPMSRQKLSAKGAVLLVDRDLGNPFFVGETISDGTACLEILAVEGTPDPKHVSLIVHVVAPQPVPCRPDVASGASFSPKSTWWPEG